MIILKSGMDGSKFFFFSLAVNLPENHDIIFLDFIKWKYAELKKKEGTNLTSFVCCKTCEKLTNKLNANN